MSPSPEQFTHLKISRPLIEADRDRFVAKIRRHAFNIFGDTSETVVTEKDSAQRGTLVIPVGNPRMKPYENPALILLHQRVATDRNYNGSFSQAADRLREREPRPRPGRSHRGQTTPLQTQLDEISRRYSIRPGEPVDIVCDRLKFTRDPMNAYRGNELALVLADEELTTEYVDYQARICREALESISKRAASTTALETGVVPFTRFPVDAKPGQVSEMLKTLEEMLPLHLTIGAVAVDHYSADSLSASV